MEQFEKKYGSTVLYKKVDNFGKIIVPLSIVQIKQFENENCSTVLIKKWIILMKLVPLSISTDETI